MRQTRHLVAEVYWLGLSLWNPGIPGHRGEGGREGEER